MDVNKKSQKIAFASLLRGFLRSSLGPITLLVISSMLTSEELGYYYLFFSIIFSRIVFENGISLALKQLYTHTNSEKTQNDYYKFSILWFRAAGVAYILFCCFLMAISLAGSDSSNVWQLPFAILILACYIDLQITSKGIILEGLQQQLVVHYGGIISETLRAVFLWLLIYLDFSIYSIGLSLLAASLARFIYYEKYGKLPKNTVKKGREINLIFKEIWPLSKVAILSSLLRFILWNSFSLITVRYGGIELLAILGLSLNLARTILSMASSICDAQLTLYSNLIFSGKKNQAFRIFRLYASLSVLAYLIVFAIYFYLYFEFPNFYLFEKLLKAEQMFWLIAFVFAMLLRSLFRTFVLSFKINPFLNISILSACITPVTFYFSITNDILLFKYICILQLLMLIYDLNIFMKKLTEGDEHEDKSNLIDKGS